MARKSTHPNRQLFDYLNGVLDNETGQAVERHLAICADCRTLADLVRALKSQAANPELKAEGARGPSTGELHPDTSELASLFYSKHRSERDEGATTLRKTAAHVARCRSCAEEVALYAQAEHKAAHYDPSQKTRGHGDAETRGRDELIAASPRRPLSASWDRAAWEMIENWEDTIYARPKPEIKPLSEDMMRKLARLLEERKDQLIEITARTLRKKSLSRRPDIETGNLVPVIVVSESGEFRSLEMFEKLSGPQGHSLLKHTDESGRFDNKPFHALLDFGEEKLAVMSYLVRHDTVRLELKAGPNTILPRAGYFIVED